MCFFTNLTVQFSSVIWLEKLWVRQWEGLSHIWNGFKKKTWFKTTKQFSMISTYSPKKSWQIPPSPISTRFPPDTSWRAQWLQVAVACPGKTLPGGVNCLLFLMGWLDVTTEWFVWHKICKQWDEHLFLWDAWELEGKKNSPFYQTADVLMDGLPLLYGWSTMWKIDQCPHVSSFAHRNLGLESET